MRFSSIDRARFYAAEIASAIGYLHSLQIIYRFVEKRGVNKPRLITAVSIVVLKVWFVLYCRDLKPENILLDHKVSGLLLADLFEVVAVFLDNEIFIIVSLYTYTVALVTWLELYQC